MYGVVIYYHIYIAGKFGGACKLMVRKSINGYYRAKTDMFEIHYLYLDPEPEPFRIVANYFRQFGNAFCMSKYLLWLLTVFEVNISTVNIITKVLY